MSNLTAPSLPAPPATVEKEAAGHTPGTWKVHPYRDVSFGPYNMGIDIGPGLQMVARVCGDFEKPVAGAEAEANAALIVAAVNAYPDLSRLRLELATATERVGALEKALQEYLTEMPVFRSKPYGAPGSPARAAQDRQIALEERARALLSAPVA